MVEGGRADGGRGRIGGLVKEVVGRGCRGRVEGEVVRVLSTIV